MRMPEEIGAPASRLTGAAAVVAALYCLQRGLVPESVAISFGYEISLALLLILMTANSYGDIVYFNLVERPKTQVKLAWLTALIVLILITVHLAIVGQPGIEFAAQNPGVHLAAGIYLLTCGASGLLGSYFAGFGFHLFLKNPISWIRYIRMLR